MIYGLLDKNCDIVNYYDSLKDINAEGIETFEIGHEDLMHGQRGKEIFTIQVIDSDDE